MTFEQISLIQQNFSSLAPRAEVVATFFYNRLFAIQPALRLLFPADLNEQKKKLMRMLGAAIKSLTEMEKLIPVLEDLGRRHALYGVRESHYNAVGAALLLTVRDALGKEFTAESHRAWAEMYQVVASTMKRAARELAQNGTAELETDFQETRKMKKQSLRV